MTERRRVEGFGGIYVVLEVSWLAVMVWLVLVLLSGVVENYAVSVARTRCEGDEAVPLGDVPLQVRVIGL
jgi:hypothetical protein